MLPRGLESLTAQVAPRPAPPSSEADAGPERYLEIKKAEDGLGDEPAGERLL